MRLIDADALLETEPEVCADYGEEYGTECGYSRDQISNAPTISPDDARGVGKWEQKEVFSLADTTIEQMQSARCSSCGKYHTTPFSYYFSKYNYCPKCGAKMEVAE